MNFTKARDFTKKEKKRYNQLERDVINFSPS